MKTKRLIAVIMALCLCAFMLAFAGCAKQDGAADDQGADTAEPEDNTPSEDAASPTDADTYVPDAEATPVDYTYGKITEITDEGWKVALFSEEGIDEKLEIEGLLYTGNMTDDKLTGESAVIDPADIDTLNIQQEDNSWKVGAAEDVTEGLCVISQQAEDGTVIAWIMDLDTTPVDSTAA